MLNDEELLIVAKKAALNNLKTLKTINEEKNRIAQEVATDYFIKILTIELKSKEIDADFFHPDRLEEKNVAAAVISHTRNRKRRIRKSPITHGKLDHQELEQEQDLMISASRNSVENRPENEFELERTFELLANYDDGKYLPLIEASLECYGNNQKITLKEIANITGRDEDTVKKYRNLLQHKLRKDGYDL